MRTRGKQARFSGKLAKTCSKLAGSFLNELPDEILLQVPCFSSRTSHQAFVNLLHLG